MDFILTEDGRRGNRQVKPRRHDFYPKWGEQKPEWNGWSFYRHGRKSLLDRYVIRPHDTPLLEMGLTVLDILVGIGVGVLCAGVLLLGSDFFGVCFDRCADRLGW